MNNFPPYERRRSRCRSRMLSDRQLARRWALRLRTLRDLPFKAALIPLIKLGRSPRYRLTDVEAFEQLHSSTSAPQTDAE